MRLNDIHLKLRPPTNVEEERVFKEERAKHANQLMGKLRLVQDLANSEGWKFFQSELKLERLRLMGMLEKTIDPTPLAKIAGTLIAVEGFANWCDDIANELSTEVKAMVEEDVEG